MSGELAHTLLHRSKVFLRLARELEAQGEYDLSLWHAEQAAQLAIKAAIYTLTGSIPRIHELRRLLGILARTLEEAGRLQEAYRIRSFASSSREGLIMLEDAYTTGKYGVSGYTREDAWEGLRLAQEILGLIGEVLGGQEEP